MTKHKCPNCPKSFQSLNDLKKHCIKYHKISYSSETLTDKRSLTIGDFVTDKEGF